MNEEYNIEITLKELQNFKKSIFSAMELIGDINLAGYTHDKVRKDTQKKLVESYDILFALNKYIELKIKDDEGD